MIRIFFFILFFAGLIGNAQFTNNHPFGNSSTLETALGGLKVNRGFINTYYADSTAANLQPIADYAGSQFFSNDTLYIRNQAGTKWLQFYVGSGGGGGGSWGSITGLLSNQTDLQNALNAKQNTITFGTGVQTALGVSIGNAGAFVVFNGDAGTPSALVGTNISGTASTLNIGGNASTATILQTARTIQGVSFNGSSNITIATGSDGITVSGIDHKLGGTIASPSYFSTERVISTNRSIMHWTNGILPESGGAFWQFSQRPYSPFQFISRDTVPGDDALPSVARPLSGIFARRTVHFPAGTYKIQQSYGHTLAQIYSWQDSFVVRTDGMDYGQAFHAEQRYLPRGSGLQVAKLGHGTGNHLRKLHGSATAVFNMYVDNIDLASTDTTYINGTLIGIIPYLVSAPATGKNKIREVVYIQTGGLVNSNTTIGRSVQIAYQTNELYTDSAYGIWDTLRVRRNIMSGSTVIGHGDSTVTGANLKVYGSLLGTTWAGYQTNVSANFTANSFTNKTYVDSSIAAIPASGTPFLPVTGTGTATGAMIGALAGNTLTISQGANSFLSIDPTAGAEGSTLQAYNTTDDDNFARFQALTINTGAQAIIRADFNNGSDEAQIELLAVSGSSTITHTADAHQFTGNVGIGVAPTVLFQVQSGGDDFLSIDPTAGAEVSALLATNATGDNNVSIFSATTSNTDATTNIFASFNDGVKVSQISAFADATTATVSYISDAHQFTGNVGIGVLPTVLFQVNSGANSFLSIDPTVDNEISTLQAFNITGAGNYAQFTAATANIGAEATIRTEFNGGAGAEITIFSVSGSNTITYDAPDGHTFSGSLFTATDNAYNIGSSVAAFKDMYGRILHLDGSTSGEVTFQSDALGNTGTSTTLSGTGYSPSVMFAALSSDFTMSDVNTVQPVFPTGFDVWTLQASTTYMFEGTYILTHNATSHSVGMSFELAGGASVTSINYYTLMHSTAINTPTASQFVNEINVTTNTALNTAGANAIETIRFWGILRVNAGGTFQPSITFSAAPGGTCLARVGTYIKFTPIGTNTATNLGNVN